MKHYSHRAITGAWIRILLTMMIITGLLGSCVTTNKSTYLQDLEDSGVPSEIYQPESYRIQPNDNLFIRVTTPDPRFSEMFNTLPTTTGSMSSTEQSVDLLSYSVHTDGTVDIPYLGSVYVAGKTVTEAEKVLQAALADYISDAGITVKLVNNYVSILGEVTRPGLYPIYKEHLNIFQALSMAGDVGEFSNRSNIKIVRSTSDGSVIREFNLTDRNIVDSAFYYVMPNDVIYVSPMKGKFFGFTQFPYMVLLSSVTTFILVLNYIQTN